jgi:hypothetical protein
MDFNLLERISLLELKPEIEAVVKKTLNKVKGQSFLRVNYKTSVKDKMALCRVYASSGLAVFPGWIRRLVSHSYYHDIDIVNACPSISLQLFTQQFGPDCFPQLKEYVEDRDGVIRRLQSKYPRQLQHKSFAEMKKLFLSGIHWGSIPHSPLMRMIPELASWTQSYCDLTAKFKTIEPYDQFWCEAELQKNSIGSFTARVWQYHERKCLFALRDFFTVFGEAAGHHPRVLIHDGLMVTRGSTNTISAELLRDAERFVLGETGISIRLAEKSLTPRDEDYTRLWGPQSTNKLSGEERSRYLLRWEGQTNGYVRMDGWVMAPHPTIPGVFKRTEESHDFISRVLENDKSYRSNGKPVPLIEWFDTAREEKFPLMKTKDFDNNVVSFKDGFFSLKQLQFTPWENYTEKPPITDHFFEETFPTDLDTPMWDALLGHQLQDRDTKRTFEMLIGRLLFPVDELDNWQVAPFVRGDADTGKGTIFQIVNKMFPAGSLGVITSNFEKTFGLECLMQKRAIVFPDMTENISQALRQDIFQSMITGEEISVARKHKTAIPDFKWPIQLMIFSNHFPDFTDDSGSISRRLVVFLFENLVKEADRDPKLKGKIVQHELARLLVKCATLYVESEVDRSKSFWEIAPQILKSSKTQLRQATNHLADFLENGDDYYQVLYVEGELTPLSDLENAYSNHMKFVKKVKDARLGTDFEPIKSAGYKKVNLKICKLCKKSYQKDCKCKEKTRKNRLNRIYFQNMRLINKRDSFRVPVL